MYIKPLPWDSEFFGVVIAKTISSHLQPGEVDLVLHECEQSRVRCLYCELDPARGDVLARVQELGFRFVELRMVLEHDLRRTPDAAPAASAGDRLVVDACPQEADKPWLEEIARSIAPRSRFAVDSGFGSEASKRLYERWLDNSLHDSAVTVLIARRDERPVGFATLRSGDAAMHLELIGVAPSGRGQGTGAKLVRAVVQAAAASGGTSLAVVTQGSNVGAVRLYERTGFRLARTSCYFHKWFG